ncbi:MAG: tRNA (adenosine(37)-N6)-threonylcarbamoyltransferase complex dimerization subunit type 1 TsaB [Clostridia bacterium]|nr:tRNA (adenosine(37)-N6)-threonylcarbamoyltransferase complex dimerization subunit type 1 TsaB [Clostridia bacterium]
MVDDLIVHTVAMRHGLTHSETIMPAVDEALEGSGLAVGDLDCIAAVAGPGSFTGVRIGVCAAKGLAHAVNVPCVQIHALEALAMNFAGFDGLVCPILDARRKQVYCAAFDVSDGTPRRVLEDAAIPLTDFLAQLPADKRLVFLGDGLGVHKETIRQTLGERAMIAPANLSDLKPEAACVLAARKQDEWREAKELVPVYLRAPQAERERNARLRGENSHE